MTSIEFNGRDFSMETSARVLEDGGLSVEPVTRPVPGRAGAVLVGGTVRPRTFRVRLFLALYAKGDAAALVSARRSLGSWLCAPGGSTLRLPDQPNVAYKNVVCTKVGPLSSVLADAHFDVTLVAFDPIAWGETRTATGTTLAVGGTWPTLPVVRATASAGSELRVSDPKGGSYVSLGRTFAGGELVVLDFEHETASVDGVDASAGVDVASDFFSLAPGSRTLAFSGCSAHEVSFCERWA